MRKTIIEILIDASGSMGYMKGALQEEDKYLIDGKTRMSLIKKMLLDEIIPTIDYSELIYIRTFRTEVEDRNGQITQKEIQTPLIYQGFLDHTTIADAIVALQDPPMGGTPITAAIKVAVSDLEKYPEADRKIILLTDGEENGVGNYIEAAACVSQMDGLSCKIFIVGIAQDVDSEAKAKAIANGGYINLKSSAFSVNEIKLGLSQLKGMVIKDSIYNIQVTERSPIIDDNPTAKKSRISHIQKLENRIDLVEREGETAGMLSRLDEIEKKISNGRFLSEDLRTDLADIREILRMQQLLRSGIDSTTMTLDREYSEHIRVKSERFLFDKLCEKYTSANVYWLNEHGESFNDHDFEIMDREGNVTSIIECKGTPAMKTTFYLTSNEWNCFLENREKYQLCRVFDVDSQMHVITLDNLLESLLKQEVVPYLLKPEILEERRVFLTLVK